MLIVENGDWKQIDYTQLCVGAPAGDRYVILCPKCKKPGLQWKKTRAVAHVVLYRRKRGTHKEDTVPGTRKGDLCKTALPKDPPHEPSRNLGFPWCPKES